MPGYRLMMYLVFVLSNISIVKLGNPSEGVSMLHDKFYDMIVGKVQKELKQGDAKWLSFRMI
mgnify:FL=1